jgi:hypothetical protein
MVNQFKNNEFERNFYDFEKRISYNNFRSAYLVPELEERLYQCTREFRETGQLIDHRADLILLRNEIMRVSDLNKDIHFRDSDWVPGAFSEEMIDKIARFLESMKEHYIRRFSAANREKERYLGRLMKDRRELYFSLLDKFHNESVSDQVKKIYEKNQIIEYEGRLYQRIDPIFLDPAPEGLGIRSHFFAPRKYFLGKYYNTFGFNMGFIWFLTLLLYLTLYYDLVGKLARSRVFRRRGS